MTTLRGRIRDLARRQHGAVARWQLAARGLRKNQIDAALRGWRRIYQGVCATDDLDELGWLMAAALAGGPGAALSHGTALSLLGLLDESPAAIHVSVPRGGERGRDGLLMHRRKRIDRWKAHGIPVTSPTQSLVDASLPPAEHFHAIDRAATLRYPLSLPLNAITTLQQATDGRTRSVAEAAFVLLCHDHGIDPPRVNQHLNGFETDFHWPDARLVVEVDGFEFHKSREQFEEDRRRGIVHNVNGYSVTRVSALQVQHDPALVAGAVTERLSAQRPRDATRRRRRPK